MKWAKKMSDTFGKLLDNKKFLLLFSFVMALVLWAFVVTNVSTEAITIINDVPITFTENSATVTGMSVITKNHSSIDIVVKGKRTVVGILSENDFVVYADYSNISEPGMYNLDVKVESTSSSADYTITSYQTKTVQVKLDRIVNKKLPVEIEISSRTSFAEGFVQGTAVSSKAEITLSGPEKEVATVASCVARLDMNAVLSESVTRTVDIELRDKDGNKIKNEFMVSDFDKVDITVPVLKKKTVSVGFQYLNLPSNVSVDALKYVLDFSSIEIAGPIDAVNNLESLDLGYIDIRDLDLNGIVKLPVTLPSGFISIDEIKEITVTFDFTGFSTKTLSYVNNIKAVNIPTGYNVAINTKRINNVTFMGDQNEIKSLSIYDVVAEVNMSEIGEISTGSVTVPVKIVVDKANVFATGEYTIVISISEK